MGQAGIDAVLAGTKGFAVALLAPLTARIGNRPRVAADPGQVLGLCSGPSALAVVEFTGEGSLPTIQALVRDGRGLRVVAGVPAAHAAAEGTLLAMGVEVGRWDGKIDGVVAAVDRAVAAMAAPPAPRAAPAAPQPQPQPPAAPRPAQPAPARPAAPGAPAASRPAAAAVRPAAGPPRAAPPAPSAAAPRPSQPAMPAAAPAPASAPAPARSAPAPAKPAAAAAANARPPAAPARPAPAAPSAARPAAAAPAPSTAAPRAGGGGDPPPPTLARGPAQGPAAPAAQARPSAAAPAVAPPPAVVIPAPPPAAVAPAPIPAPPPAAAIPAPAAPAVAPPAAAAAPAASPAPAGPAASRPAANFFDDLDADDVPIDEEPPAPAVDFHAPGVYVPPPPAAAVQWPSGLCTDAEAEAALRAALGGACASTLEALAAKVLEAASELEREVLEGKPQPIDTAPLRRATVMRLRVAQALDSAPPVGNPVDGVAVSTILGQIDGLLAEVAPLLQGASEELAPALEAVRNSLVREAIDFSEAASRVRSAEAPPAQAPVAPPREKQARLLSVEQPVAEAGEEHRKRLLFVVLGCVLLAAAAYHGYAWYKRKFDVPRQPGIPAGMLASGSANGPRLVSPYSSDVQIDPAEVARFKAEQRAKGYTVTDVGNGAFLIERAPAPRSDDAGKQGKE